MTFGQFLGACGGLLLGTYVVRVGVEFARRAGRKLPAGAKQRGSFLHGGFLGEMTAKEATQILEVDSKATAAEIKKRHLRVMMLNHPDQGGSPYMASKINEAKEFLLGKKGPTDRAF